MRIYTKAGDLAFRTFTFPDGQPHFKLETYEREFSSVTVETSIRNPVDLFTTLIVSDVLRQHGYAEINLDVRYLMGARMDRSISSMEPFTLATVSRLINGAGFSRVRILDVHSEVATRLIRNSVNVLPFKVVDQVIASTIYPWIICPDKGAIERTRALANGRMVVQCSKKRDITTGALTGFQVHDFHFTTDDERNSVLIIDDICDGGGTFVGLAKELRAAGAKKVFLYVTHGIFSKGLPLDGIDRLFTTDSYHDPKKVIGGDTFECLYPDSVTVIPISMKELA